MEVGDDGAMGPSRLGYYKHKTASPTANVTRAMHASPAPAYDARAHSLRTGARQRCACVFIVHTILGRKLSFLQHILDSDGESVSGRVLVSLSGGARKFIYNN